MADFRKIRNEKLGAKVVKALQSRNMEAWYVDNKEEALKKALEIIPVESTVGWGGTVSVEEIGLKPALEARGNKLLDRYKAATPEERDDIQRQCLLSDYFLMSTNAISEDGIMVNIDGLGNRVAALIYGPKNVLMIVGMNKVVKTEADALSRARNEAAPVNAQRFNLSTPCSKNGSCADCRIPDTICCQFVTTRYSKVAGRIKVILVGEDLGF